jgi:hypothetical protein
VLAPLEPPRLARFPIDRSFSAQSQRITAIDATTVTANSLRIVRTMSAGRRNDPYAKIFFRRHSKERATLAAVLRSGSGRALTLARKPIARDRDRVRAWFALVFGLFCLASPRPVRADTLDFSLRYMVPPGCPSASWFTAAVQARRAAPFSAKQRGELTVTLVGDEAHSQGSLEIALPQGQSTARVIPEAPCTDALTSMAVVAAMVLDGRDLDGAAPIPAPTFSHQPKTHVTPASAPGWHRASAARPPSPRRTAAWQPGVAVGLGPMNAVAPTATWVFALGAELALATERVLAPQFRLSGAFGSNSDSITPVGRAQFRLISLDARACPLSLHAAAILRVATCARFDVGDLRARAQSIQHMRWLALGLAVRLESWVRPWLAFELEPSAARLWRDDRFVVEPGRWAYDVPTVNVGLRFGLLFRPR